MLKYLGVLFGWMKYYHIFKNNYLYKRIDANIIKYSWLFYFSKLIYPMWILIGLFTGNIIYVMLLFLSIIKYMLYPLLKGKAYRWYVLIESFASIILYIILLF